MIWPDKSRFIHANYRFIVDPRGDYHTQAADADVHLDWNHVLQILASAPSQSTSCPICLSVPVAPRMAKCGHIFCFPCLIRYMHSTDDESMVPEKKARRKSCPICWDNIYQSETRPVRWFTGQEGEPPKEGGDVVLRLVLRRPGSILALPRDSAESGSMSDDIPWYVAAEVTDYARIMKGGESYMLEHFDREIREIRFQEKEDELMFGDETRWTSKAVAAISEAKEKLKGIGDPPIAPPKPKERRKVPGTTSNTNQHADQFGKVIDSTSDPSTQSFGPTVDLSSKVGEIVQETAQEPTREITPDMPRESVRGSARERNRGHSDSSNSLHYTRAKATHTADKSHGQSFFFYQALLHYYLSPLDIRIIKAAYTDYSAFPTTILPRVERISTGHIVDDDLRKRAKYLAHLPQGCEVNFLECNWTDVVIPEILESFRPEIERRRKRNMDKEMREEKARARAEKEEDDMRWANARRKRPSISREMLLMDMPPLRDTDQLSTSASIDLTATSASPPWTSQHRSGSAFASLATPSSSPSTSRTVWGTALVASVSPQIEPNFPPDSENDGWFEGWEDDDLAMKVHATHIGTDDARSGINGSSGKKKKGKRITLMTTNGRRGL